MVSFTANALFANPGSSTVTPTLATVLILFGKRVAEVRDSTSVIFGAAFGIVSLGSGAFANVSFSRNLTSGGGRTGICLLLSLVELSVSGECEVFVLVLLCCVETDTMDTFGAKVCGPEVLIFCE